jgi:hypothetical protein
MEIDQDRFDKDLIHSKLHDVFYLRNRYIIKTWEDFINKKDLGIVCNINSNYNYGSCYFFYQITDEHKWILTKMKYGI